MSAPLGLSVLLPVAKAKGYGPVVLTMISAQQRATPRGRERIRWRLLTELPVHSLTVNVRRDASLTLAEQS